jgi:hypothetical protein
MGLSPLPRRFSDRLLYESDFGNAVNLEFDEFTPTLRKIVARRLKSRMWQQPFLFLYDSSPKEVFCLRPPMGGQEK